MNERYVRPKWCFAASFGSLRFHNKKDAHPCVRASTNMSWTSFLFAWHCGNSFVYLMSRIYSYPYLITIIMFYGNGACSAWLVPIKHNNRNDYSLRLPCVKGEFSELLNEEFGSSPNKYILSYQVQKCLTILRSNNTILMKYTIFSTFLDYYELFPSF